MGIKYKFDIEFFKKWTREMAYVLGYWYADGNILDATKSTRGKYSSVTSTDKETILSFKSLLSAEHSVGESFRTGAFYRRKQYTLRIGSHELYDILVKRGLCPNKSLTMNFPEVPKMFLADFIRGYFDGDGCVHLEKSKDGKLIKRLRTIFTSGSKQFLHRLKGQLNESANMKNGLLTISHRSFQLRYSTAESVQLFKFFYKKAKVPLFLKRKLKTFLGYFAIRPQRVDKEVAAIIRCLNGHVVK